MAAKRKAQKKSKAGKAKIKATKPARKAVVKKSAIKKALPRRAARKTAKPDGLVVKTNPALEARLRMLATKMGIGFDALIVQALNEFADNWEDHLRTVAALQDTEDRVHLSVPKE
jgi:hypothetical protein